MSNKYSIDPIRSAKASGKGYSDTSKSCEYFPTPDSKPSANDGRLGGKNSPDGAKGFAPINETAKCCTYTGKGGSKSYPK